MFCTSWFWLPETITSVTDDYIYKVSAKITSIEIGPEKTKINLENKNRDYWLSGTTTVDAGDQVNLWYQLHYINDIEQAWICRMQKL